MTTTSSQPHDSAASVSREIVYCTRCVVSNQRPRISFNAEGVCSACQYAAKKDTAIDWEARERELQELCDRHRSKDGRYDVLVPASGGKDSSTIAHRLRDHYGMHPLTATWAPNLWTEIGRRNLDNFIAAGFDNVLGRPAGNVNRRLVELAFEHMGEPFQPFIYGVEAHPIRTAIQYGIKLIMYAEEGESEYGGSTKNEGRATVDMEEDLAKFYFSGVPPEYWMKYGLTFTELQPYFMPDAETIRRSGLEYRHFSHYKKWIPQENYYYASEHCGFVANPERSEGTYSKYASLDDKTDGFHYYLMFIKFGIGRATSDAAHEIRDGHLVREEGVALVKRFDGEFPAKYFNEFLEYAQLDEGRFWRIVDSFRTQHVWRREGNEWVLRSQVS